MRKAVTVSSRMFFLVNKGVIHDLQNIFCKLPILVFTFYLHPKQGIDLTKLKILNLKKISILPFMLACRNYNIIWWFNMIIRAK